MAGPSWKNVYRLSDSQISSLDEAEEKMEKMDITGAEEILLLRSQPEQMDPLHCAMAVESTSNKMPEPSSSLRE